MLAFLLNLSLLLHATHSAAGAPPNAIFVHDPYADGQDVLQDQQMHRSQSPMSTRADYVSSAEDQRAQSSNTASVPKLDDGASNQPSSGTTGAAGDAFGYHHSPVATGAASGEVYFDAFSAGHSNSPSDYPRLLEYTPTRARESMRPTPLCPSDLATPLAATVAAFPLCAFDSPDFQHQSQQRHGRSLVTPAAGSSMPALVASPSTSTLQFSPEPDRSQAFAIGAQVFHPLHQSQSPVRASVPSLETTPIAPLVVIPVATPVSPPFDRLVVGGTSAIAQPFIPVAQVIHPMPSQPPLPTEQPRSLEEYTQRLPNAIIAKFKDTRLAIKNEQQPMERQLFEMYRLFRGQTLGEMPGLDDAARSRYLFNNDVFRKNLHIFEKFIFGQPPDIGHSPHVLIQSDYIFLWSNVNIYYAMNYILSPFCKGFDEMSVVSILKQLTKFADRNPAKSANAVQIIKAIWDRLFMDECRAAKRLKKIVLNHEKKNIASYSMRTLAVEHMDYNEGILQTLFRLSEEEIAAGSNVKLETYNCLIRRFTMIHHQKADFQRMMRVTWNVWRAAKSKLSRLKASGQQKIPRSVARPWEHLMLEFCWQSPGLVNDLRHDVIEFFGSC